MLCFTTMLRISHWPVGGIVKRTIRPALGAFRRMGVSPTFQYIRTFFFVVTYVLFLKQPDSSCTHWQNAFQFNTLYGYPQTGASSSSHIAGSSHVKWPSVRGWVFFCDGLVQLEFVSVVWCTAAWKRRTHHPMAPDYIWHVDDFEQLKTFWLGPVGMYRWCLKGNNVACLWNTKQQSVYNRWELRILCH